MTLETKDISLKMKNLKMVCTLLSLIDIKRSFSILFMNGLKLYKYFHRVTVVYTFVAALWVIYTLMPSSAHFLMPEELLARFNSNLVIRFT